MTVTLVSNLTRIGRKESDNFHKDLFRIRDMTSFLKTPQTYYIVLFTVSDVKFLHIFRICTGSSATGYQATAESERSNSILNTPSNMLDYMLQIPL